MQAEDNDFDKRTSSKRPKKFICDITGHELPRKQMVVVDSLRPSLADHIKQDFPNIDEKKQ